jgi:hypothetical protein
MIPDSLDGILYGKCGTMMARDETMCVYVGEDIQQYWIGYAEK